MGFKVVIDLFGESPMWTWNTSQAFICLFLKEPDFNVNNCQLLLWHHHDCSLNLYIASTVVSSRKPTHGHDRSCTNYKNLKLRLRDLLTKHTKIRIQIHSYHWVYCNKNVFWKHSPVLSIFSVTFCKKTNRIALRGSQMFHLSIYVEFILIITKDI